MICSRRIRKKQIETKAIIIESTVQNISSIAPLYIPAVSTEMVIVIFCAIFLEAGKFTSQKYKNHISRTRKTNEDTLQIVSTEVCLWNLLSVEMIRCFLFLKGH
jgi:hypothetical protein